MEKAMTIDEYLSRKKEILDELFDLEKAMLNNLTISEQLTNPTPVEQEVEKNATLNDIPKMEDVRATAKAHAKKHGKEATKKIITKFGVNIAAVSVDDYPILLEELKV